MVRSRRGSESRKLLGSHQRSWLWGRHLVSELLQSGRWPIVQLLLAADLPEGQREHALLLAQTHRFPTEIAPRERLTQLCHTNEHQGYLAQMGPFPYATPADLRRQSAATPLLLILDGLQDPYNFGAIVRSAEVLGVRGVIVRTTRQSPVTSMVARSSVGAVIRIPIVQVEELSTYATGLARDGYAVVAASEKAPQTLTAFDFRQPVALVIGNEGTGISAPLQATCTATVRIPQQGSIGSLNAAAAAAILCYEAQRQRHSQEGPRSSK